MIEDKSVFVLTVTLFAQLHYNDFYFYYMSTYVLKSKIKNIKLCFKDKNQKKQLYLIRHFYVKLLFIRYVILQCKILKSNKTPFM